MTPIVIAIVGGIVLLWLIAIGAFVLLGRRQTVVEERLGEFTKVGQVAVAAPREEAVGPRVSPLGELFNRALEGRSFADGISRDLARADLKLNVGEYLALHVISAFGLTFVGWLLGGRDFSLASIVFAVGAGLFGLFVPRIYVGYQQRGRLTRFDNQLGDMLNLVVNGLRAGYSVMQALEAVSRELPPPISAEFRRVVQEMQLGLPMETALSNLTRRIPSKDLDFVVTAINVQREVGGNLAEILDTISYTIRERVRIKGEIATLTAQGMMTGYVISGLPIALGLFLYIVNRAYMGQFFMRVPGKSLLADTYFLCGIGMVITALLMIGIGFAIVMKIVNIEV
jgi:tight adherence protein B